MDQLQEYNDFLAEKAPIARRRGFDITPDDVHPILKPHQRASVVWAVSLGRAAMFSSFGLGKSLQQIEALRLTREKAGGGNCLIVLPLGVRQEFRRDGAMIGVEPKFIRRAEEIDAHHWLYLTNYETIRDGKLDPGIFVSTSLDEAAVLRGFGGTKTFREFMRVFESVPYRFVATATPSPNEYIELLSYAAYLGIIDVGEGKTRWFKRDSTKADQLTLHPHKEREFWLWVASWALFLNKPSDMGYSDEGYDLPPLEVHWHEVPSDHSAAGAERDGQGRMFRNAAFGVSDAAREKRDSLGARIDKLMELRAIDPAAHRIIWHDLEAERHAIEASVPGVVSVFGAQDVDDREVAIVGFSNGEIAELAAKPVMLGAGTNLQRHCSWAIFLGIGFKFHDFVQAIHRLRRFLQPKQVRLDLIYSEAERDIRRQLEAKWKRHDEMVATMSAILREYGLTHAALSSAMSRSIGADRVEVRGDGWRLVNNDSVCETLEMPGNSVDLIVTSIPFATQYEYTPSYNDFGHTDDNDHFWRQMDFLSPNLLRVLAPGRVMAIHVKDRITPGGVNGLGFQTLHPFHAEAIAHYTKHGFALIGMKTIVTDVVRENNQTYRLGWSEQCKDGSRMGCGVPEYLLLFRKPPSDLSNGYADVPVMKEKPLCDDHGVAAPFDSRTNWKKPVPGSGYSRGKWQLDAHGFSRSSGDRLLSSEELSNMPHDQIYKWWRERSVTQVYDFDEHVQVSEEMDAAQRLPATFMLLPPHSWHPDVWTDVTRMRTLNGAQHAAGREMHLCPMQFDIVDRCIEQFSMKGETVFDPFSGLGTTPYRAVLQGRRGLGVELSTDYWRDAIVYLRAAEAELSIPSLFELLEAADD